MEQNLNSEKTPARPAHQHIENKVSTNEDSEHKRLDETAMKAARRAENRFREDEDKVPGSTVFTK